VGNDAHEILHVGRRLRNIQIHATTMTVITPAMSRPPHQETPLTPRDLVTLLGRAGVTGFADEVLRLMATPWTASDKPDPHETASLSATAVRKA